MDWTNIIIALITSGAFTGIFFIAERKTAAAIKNSNSQYEVLKNFCEDLQNRYDKETDKVGKLYDEISQLHTELDKATTRAAVAELKRCDVINCTSRKPPFGVAESIEYDTK